MTDEAGALFVDAQRRQPALRRGLPDQGGGFEVAGAPAQRWALQVTRPGYAPERRTLTVMQSSSRTVRFCFCKRDQTLHAAAHRLHRMARG